MKNKLYKIYIQIILANVFWGFSFVWTDIALKENIRPITLVSMRMIIATILLGILAKYTGNLQKIANTEEMLDAIQNRIQNF